MLVLNSSSRFSIFSNRFPSSSRYLIRSKRYNFYSTSSLENPISKTSKKGILRRVVLPTALFGGIFYGAGIYGSFHNEKIHDFFVDQVPLGETLLNYFEESNLEQFADMSKRVIEISARTAKTAKETLGLTSSVEDTENKSSSSKASDSSVDQINQRTTAALQSTKELKPSPVLGSSSPTHETQSNSTSDLELKPAALVGSFRDVGNSVTQVSPQQSDLPYYDQPIPIGHEPPPGFVGVPPRPREPVTGLPPTPPSLPLLAPGVKGLSATEPVLGQLASSIDSLAGFLRDHPEVVVRGKDASGKDASRVLSSAKEELKRLADRLESIKLEEQAQLQTKLQTQAKNYGKMLLEAERELHQRLDQQEENWKDTFEVERSRLAKSFDEKLAKELEIQEALINERLEQEVISKGLELQRRWMRQIKAQVELEREGRWGKLSELEGCMKELGRITLDNEEYLEENLRVNQLWNAIRALEAAAFGSTPKVPLDYEARALQRISARNSKLASTSAQDADQSSTDSNVISAALSSIPLVAIETGIETLPSLTVWFKDSVAPRIQSASLFPSHGGLFTYLTSCFLSNLLFTSASSSPHAKDPICILSRVNGYLDAKNLEEATRELNSLKGWPKVLAKDWIGEARRHLELQQAIQIIQTEAKLQSLLL
ncbi:hypothetical protein O181_025693 [Austropuccinia psidii MF-1]|uniref:MICOS complex subunit MIC60 n=1 Tax=Austropuccinia psidii MF-1 TaxID=1389203 RepID=A0A9Q3GZC7_9BASI|nr:hypothetical protein [Austropuccinia psidii MF-1]